jgi:hypothetical protein
MYMMRLVYHCKRGRCLDVVECLRFLNQIYTGDGYKNGKIYVDRMGRMDRALYEFEVANLDQFYTVLKTVCSPCQPRPRGAAVSRSPE